jgi:inorganic pyrophosphatase/exopolyphosphatase
MNLYKISQSENRDYDTYDSAIVAAETDEEARQIHPCPSYGRCNSNGEFVSNYGPEWPQRDWAPTVFQVNVEFIGTAKDGTEAGVILASFNAG